VSTQNSSAAAGGGDPKTWEGAAEDLTPLEKENNQTFFSFCSSQIIFETLASDHTNFSES